MAVFILEGCSLCLKHVWGRMRLETRFSLSLCMPGAPLRRVLKVTAVFCSKNARGSGHIDVWEGRAIPRSSRIFG